MSLTGATLFSGFGGADLGMQAAGIDVRWGLDLDPAIAAVAQTNGLRVRVGDVTTADTDDFERVDVLHASPPCPNFSLAKTGRAETAHDLLLATSVTAFIHAIYPQFFTLENVRGYAASRSWRIIENELHRLGYWGVVQIVDAADYGVPQNRVRMIARYARGRMVQELHPTVTRWTGWYKAIEDLIPTLPETQFAPWQLARLPEKLTTAMIGNRSIGDEREAVNMVMDSDPAFTITTQAGKNKAYLVDGDNARPDTGEPTIRQAGDPAMTIRAQRQPTHRAWLSQGKVVKITPRCLARFQSFPDGYELPEKSVLACKGIGNALPPKLAAAIFRSVEGEND